MKPKNKELPGFILELKTEKDCSPSELKKLAQEALKQITDKRYEAEMAAEGVQPIVCYGIAFSGKNTEISCETKS